MRSKDITKNKYGKLTPLERVGRDKWRSALWRCKCDCGKEAVVDAKSLRRGNTKSCGCIHKLEKGKASENYWYRAYLEAAKKRNLKWEITKEQFLKIIKQNCSYCGQSPELREVGNLNGGVIMNGLDRIDSKRDYSIDNITACCKKCNQFKWDFSIEEFKEHIKKVASFLKIV